MCTGKLFRLTPILLGSILFAGAMSSRANTNDLDWDKNYQALYKEAQARFVAKTVGQKIILHTLEGKTPTGIVSQLNADMIVVREDGVARTYAKTNLCAAYHDFCFAEDYAKWQAKNAVHGQQNTYTDYQAYRLSTVSERTVLSNALAQLTENSPETAFTIAYDALRHDERTLFFVRDCLAQMQRWPNFQGRLDETRTWYSSYENELCRARIILCLAVNYPRLQIGDDVERASILDKYRANAWTALFTFAEGPCPNCNGTGKQLAACEVCGGTGNCYTCNGTGHVDAVNRSRRCTACNALTGVGKCRICRGSGRTPTDTCARCRGRRMMILPDKARSVAFACLKQESTGTNVCAALIAIRRTLKEEASHTVSATTMPPSTPTATQSAVKRPKVANAYDAKSLLGSTRLTAEGLLGSATATNQLGEVIYAMPPEWNRVITGPPMGNDDLALTLKIRYSATATVEVVTLHGEKHWSGTGKMKLGRVLPGSKRGGMSEAGPIKPALCDAFMRLVSGGPPFKEENIFRSDKDPRYAILPVKAATPSGYMWLPGPPTVGATMQRVRSTVRRGRTFLSFGGALMACYFHISDYEDPGGGTSDVSIGSLTFRRSVMEAAIDRTEVDDSVLTIVAGDGDSLTPADLRKLTFITGLDLGTAKRSEWQKWWLANGRTLWPDKK